MDTLNSGVRPGTPEETSIVVPVRLIGKRDRSIEFTAVAIGISENGLGFRSSDPRLGVAALEALIRQPFECRFEAKGVVVDEILVRIIRIEACRKDPAYLYFGACDFLSISDVDQLTLQTGLRKFERKSAAREPVISAPVPPPGKRSPAKDDARENLRRP